MLHSHSFISESLFYDKKDKGAITLEVTRNMQFMHEDYDKRTSPQNLYDVGLIKLGQKIPLSKKLHTVCLWNSSYAGKVYGL